MPAAAGFFFAQDSTQAPNLPTRKRRPRAGECKVDLKEMDLADLLLQGRGQAADLTYYRLVFASFERLTYQNSSSYEVYRNSLFALVSGYLASLRPEYLPQAVAAKNLMMKRAPF